MLQIKGSQC